MIDGKFHRTELLIGEANLLKIQNSKVIVFGIGGVGSWAVEGLIRTGFLNITIVDSDRICVTNINRQLQATTKTVGLVKTEALKSRMLEINPKANITAIQDIYSKDNYEKFELHNYDYIIDAIDSLGSKVHLLYHASKTNAKIITSMGASLRIDPTKIKVSEFWDVKGCRFGSKVRKMMRQTNQVPEKNRILAVFSQEILDNIGENKSCGSTTCLCPHSENGPGKAELVNHEWCSMKAVINGTLVHITAIFGFTISGLISKDICNFS